MKTSLKILCVLAAFLSLGTTFVIKEGGMEVGRWVEQDGHEGEQIIENDKPSARPVETPDAPVNPQESATEDIEPAIDQDLKDARVKASCFSVSHGDPRPKVESTASGCGFLRTSKYSDIKATPSGETQAEPEWIYDYEYRNEKVVVRKKIIFEARGWTVLRVEEFTRSR
ncbi:MAG TPA: hypothetical protein VL688_09765 [Verrucomicrobiae bacterium]|nr:hypothetical protein [Verrucomicrobiae bacterium]